MEMATHAFGDGIKVKMCDKTNAVFKPLRVSSYQFGGLRRIYTEQLVFYEDLSEYPLGQIRLEIEKQRKIKEEATNVLKDWGMDEWQQD
jgi:hypothetical protein